MDDLQPQVPDATLPAVPADVESGALAEHEAAYSPVADVPASDEGRDEQTGRFQKPRRRAASQQADADDVPAINELTKRLKTAEEAAGKDITRKDGESERVFTLRRRAEIAERLAAPPKPAAEPAKPAAPAVSDAPIAPSRPLTGPSFQQPTPQAFPSYEAFVALEGLANATYEDYTDARADWRYTLQRTQERQQDAAQSAQRDFQTKATAHQQRVTAAKATYPDWDQVVTAELPISAVLRDAVLACAQSADVQYYLGQHRDDLAALVAESQDYSPSAVSAMRRYLDTLVAPQRSSPPTRAAAGSTGSALALAPPPAPRPPNPVRTGAVTPADDAPGDDNQSLAAHEQHFGRRRRS